MTVVGVFPTITLCLGFYQAHATVQIPGENVRGGDEKSSGFSEGLL